MEASGVSVVVVSYNTREKLRRCLSCIEPEHEVIVVDNASSDGSADMVRADFPHVRLIENRQNVGFGAANNQGMAVASGELVLFLNSDCYAEPGAITELSRSFDIERWGLPKDYACNPVAAGGRLNNPDGTLQESVAGELTLFAVFLEQTYLERFAGRFRYWRTDSTLYEQDASPSQAPRKVDQVMGACLMIRPLEKFDERFFLYCEDTDLCKRLSRHGDIVYNGQAIFTHELGSSSTGSGRWLSVARYNRGKELYFSIHHGSFAMAVCWLLDRFGAFLRLCVYTIAGVLTLFVRPGPRAKIVLWWKVLTASPRLR